MITVEDVLDKNKRDAQTAAEQNDELLRTGGIKSGKQGYLPWILLALAGIGLGVWAFMKGKNQNGAVSG